jgi:hypothetical protein
MFCTRIKELAAGTATSSVPVIIKTGLDIFESSVQAPLQFLANQFSTTLNCCTKVLELTISEELGIVSR